MRQRLGVWISAGMVVVTLVLSGMAGAAVSGKASMAGASQKHRPVCWKC